jgi:hypothetical protein
MTQSSNIKLSAMIVHALVLLVGMTGLYFGYLQFQKTKSLLSTGIVITATVIENIMEVSDESDMYRPRFQFMDKNHKPVQFTGTVSSSRQEWSVGETTSVVYIADRPDTVRIISYWNLYRATILLTALASPFLVIGMGYFLFHLFSENILNHA